MPALAESFQNLVNEWAELKAQNQPLKSNLSKMVRQLSLIMSGKNLYRWYMSKNYLIQS